MESSIEKLNEKIVSVWCTSLVYRERLLCIGIGVGAAFALITAFTDPAFAQGLIGGRSTDMPVADSTLIGCAGGALFDLIEGNFGAVIMIVAGLGAIVSAAMGAYRATVGMLVVAVGSFILRALVSFFFDSSDLVSC